MKRFMTIVLGAAILTGTAAPAITHAAEYSLKEMTPQVEAALNSRKARFDELEALKAGGTVGENNRGYVELLEDDAAAAEIVQMENRDRKVIYRAIADQNGLTDQIATIERVFAQVQAEKASSGYKVQDADGTWHTK